MHITITNMANKMTMENSKKKLVLLRVLERDGSID
jgi:hypothetical protein